jgi:NAD(P)-dependent dehydrogenase (short-subunit alcohol dehydrogenase family)
MSKPNVSLKGRVAVVTGSTRGIGRAIAEHYGAAGAQVVISSNWVDTIEPTVAELRARGIDASGFSCDVSQRAQVEDLLHHALAVYGKVDIWVNNAAISGPYAYTIEMPPNDWERVIEVNLMGCYYGCVTVLPHMIERRYGKLINLSGGGYKRAQRFLSAYSASKAGIVRLTEALAREHKEEKNLAINVLLPGIVPTDMTMNPVAIGSAAEVLKQLPRVMRIFGTTTEETAAMALHMASPATDGVAGKVFEILPPHRAFLRMAQAAIGRR